MAKRENQQAQHTQPTYNVHENGPGLKVVGDPTHPWYGSGYCAICGDRGPSLVPVRVRYWDPDDGWRSGVLCVHCGRDATARGPRPDDYAVAVSDPVARAALLDVIGEANAGDDDAAHVECEEA